MKGNMVTYYCLDCGYTKTVSNKKADSMDGTRCPQCDGPLYVEMSTCQTKR